MALLIDVGFDFLSANDRKKKPQIINLTLRFVTSTATDLSSVI